MSRKPSWYSVTFVSLMAAMVFVPAVAQVRHSHREASMPHTLEEAAERIKTAHPEWKIVAAREDGNVANGFYAVKASSQDVRGLPRYLSHLHLWSGVVFISSAQTVDTTDNTFERGTIVGDYYLYGDKYLYPTLRADLGHH